MVGECTGESFECPLCAKPTQKMQALHMYLPHFEVLSKIDSEKMADKDFGCEECVSGDQADTFCQECVMNLCAICTRQHQRAKATARHSLIEGTSNRTSRIHRAQYCATHRNCRYDLYCEDCETLICRQCACNEHQSHNYKLPTNALVDRQRQRVKDIVEVLCTRLLDGQVVQKTLEQADAATELDS
ncbi:unnamed protein product [Polarella glacialis]|uniref:B box-type domain-containing protein n=1 Tax=Polarella glacialis TaxID=89957 RepID=A0A813GSA4_POLGL|nr:unnamed protein product [Polarella glacialis]CAE8627065.1 unnamed protein product [Polarella glacialis]